MEAETASLWLLMDYIILWWFYMPDGERTIAAWNLNDALFTEDTAYLSIEAQQIDEGIFFFVNENHLKLSNDELALEVLRQLV